MVEFGRVLLVIGLVIAFAGLALMVAARFFPWLGNLPGDFRIGGGQVRFYFPLATMILVSILATVLLNVLLRIFNR